MMEGRAGGKCHNSRRGEWIGKQEAYDGRLNEEGPNNSTFQDKF